MTPKEFCEYIVAGKIFQEIESDEADHAELGQYIWPDRYDRLVEIAKEALTGKDECSGCEYNKGMKVRCLLPSLTPCPRENE